MGTSARKLKVYKEAEEKDRGKLLNNVSRQWDKLVNNLSIPRSFLLDQLTDIRRNLDRECGYPPAISIPAFRLMWDRFGPAARVTGVYPDECWSVYPEIYENEQAKLSKWEKAWLRLTEYPTNIWSYLHRVDHMSGIGHYGILLLGFDDGNDLNVPLPGIDLETGQKVGNYEHKLIYLRVFDETLLQIPQFEKDVNSPRYGMPIAYKVKFFDPAAMSGIMTPLSATELFVFKDIHWTRVVHICDNRTSSEVFGIPRQQQVFNQLLDLRKVLSGSAEMFWKGAFPGYSFETLPSLTDESDLDMESIKEQFEQFSNGLQRYMATSGMTAKSLAPQVADPRAQAETIIAHITAVKGVPMRIFMGSESGHLASTQDVQTWNRRMALRQRNTIKPYIIMPVIQRLMAAGTLPMTDITDLKDSWQDLNLLTETDKAARALQMTQALMQYTTGGIEEIMTFMDYCVHIMGFELGVAETIVANSSAADRKKLTEEVWQEPPQPVGADGKGNISGRPPRNAQGAKKKGKKKK